MAGAEKRALRQPTIFLLGVRVDSLDFGAALRMLEGFAAHRDSLPPRTVMFAGARTICAARRDHRLRDFISRADLVLPSGFGVAMGARILGTPLREKLDGAEFLCSALEAAQRSGMRVYLLGGDRGRAAEYRAQLFIRYPRLRIVGSRDRVDSQGDEERAGKEISALHPDILLVAMGIRAQEEWISRNLNRLRAGVCIAAGGELDSVCGSRKDAVDPIGRMRIETLFRSLTEPIFGGISKVVDSARFFTLVLAKLVVPRRLRLMLYRREMPLREH